jgi:signal transduction histidine kinase
LVISSEEICAQLESWPKGLVSDLRKTAEDALIACASMFEASSALIVWEDAEEPWMVVGRLADGVAAWTEEAADGFTPLVHDGLSALSFFVRYADEETVLVGSGEDSLGLCTPAINGRILGLIDGESVLSFPLNGDSIRGRIFVVTDDVPPASLLPLTQVIGSFVVSRLESVAALRNTLREAVSDERNRVARDLHDGLLQSFTGVVLRLDTIHNMLADQPDEARRMITEVEGTIMADQRELRTYVEQLRPRLDRGENSFDFNARLEELHDRFATQWGVEVEFDVDMDPLIAKYLGQETFRMIMEAVTNSAKHGSATRIHVQLRTGQGQLRIVVVDNGSGFPFQGKRSFEELRQTGSGPSILGERVASLNGELSVESHDDGATVEITLPLGWTGE